MNRKHNDIEQIENYLRGKMSGEEMKAFEHQLQTDPTLASEFNMQQDIINAIKENRKAELKARLDNVQVGSYGSSSLTGMKIALTVALTAATGLGLYFYNQNDEPLEKEAIELVHPEETISFTGKEAAVEPEAEVPAEAIEDNNSISAITENKEGNKKAEITASNIGNEKDEAVPSLKESNEDSPSKGITKIDPPQPKEYFEDVDETGTEIKVPENTLAKATSEPEVTAVEIENKEDNSHTFHYKFYNSKLYLYGDFKNIPYEIIELNTISGKSLYLYYKDSFYYLEPNQMEVSPLQQIKDENLTEELEGLRMKK